MSANFKDLGPKKLSGNRGCAVCVEPVAGMVGIQIRERSNRKEPNSPGTPGAMLKSKSLSLCEHHSVVLYLRFAHVVEEVRNGREKLEEKTR